MSYCHDKAIPHSEFLERWSEDDRAKVFAYIAEHAAICQMCGTAPWQWAEDKYAFEPVVEVCHGCQKKDILRDDDQKLPAGASIVLIDKDEAKRRRQAEEDRKARQKEKARAWSPSTSS